jgi:hypothetical protein
MQYVMTSCPLLASQRVLCGAAAIPIIPIPGV